MRLSAPKQITWIVALILGVVGILASQGAISIVTASVGVWLLVVAWALLLLGALLRGL